MSIEAFLEQVNSGAKVSFQQTMAVIAAHYDYVPTAFRNGTVNNDAGVNEGSCKLFYFAKLHQLSPTQTLSLFGDYYWQEVLGNPDGQNHGNIRAFMRTGWDGIIYAGVALTPRVQL